MNETSLMPSDPAGAPKELAALEARMRQPGHQVNVDGSFDLGWGTMLLCGGLSSYFNAALPESISASPWTAWILYLPLVCMAFAPYAVPKTVKKFITWPRVGYVANPNEVKFLQLLRIMAFGLALGVVIALPFIVAEEISDLIHHTGPRGLLRSVVQHSIELVLCAGLVIYLGRKVITKRQPLPSAYDATVITEGLRQTPGGTRQLRVVRFTLHFMIIGVPILLAGLVFWLMYLSRSVLHHVEVRWPQLAVMGVVVTTNALLYLMGNAVAIRQHRWKWGAIGVMLIGPILVASAIPYTSDNPGLAALEFFPPPVMLFIGLVWFLSGALTLMLFMRGHPLADGEAGP